MINSSQNRSAFTLLELMISISILALIMLFLYQSLATLQKSNRFFGKKIELIDKKEKIKKLFFLDLSLMLIRSYATQKVERDEDRVFFQTSNSIHHRYNPYVAYLVSEKHLYRIEASKKVSYPLEANSDMDVDDLGEVKGFRIYSNTKLYRLLHTRLDGQEYLMKVRSLNEI